jgi:hypothetical protein
MQGRDAFAAGLRELGIEPELSYPDSSLLSFPWRIENGPRAGEEVTIGLQVPPNFPLEPPHGPCYRPAILRASGLNGVHANSVFGEGWDHWSRPHPRWPQTARTVPHYLRHLRTLNEELPPGDSEELAVAA